MWLKPDPNPQCPRLKVRDLDFSILSSKHRSILWLFQGCGTKAELREFDVEMSFRATKEGGNYPPVPQSKPRFVELVHTR